MPLHIRIDVNEHQASFRGIQSSTTHLLNAWKSPKTVSQPGHLHMPFPYRGWLFCVPSSSDPLQWVQQSVSDDTSKSQHTGNAQEYNTIANAPLFPLQKILMTVAGRLLSGRLSSVSTSGEDATILTAWNHKYRLWTNCVIARCYFIRSSPPIIG